MPSSASGVSASFEEIKFPAATAWRMAGTVVS